MSRLSVPSFESATGSTAEVYGQIKKAIGNVPNTFAAIGAHGPEALKAILLADSVLAAGSLTKRDQETIKLVISDVAGCDYCVAAQPARQARGPQAGGAEEDPRSRAHRRCQA